jgi:hypothetical protein
LFTQGTAGIGSDPERDDEFGSALAAGDFDANGADDLAIGTPIEAVGAASGAGIVQSVYGVDGGFLNAGRASQMLLWDRLAISEPMQGGGFGHALVTADFGSDGTTGLVIGVPGAWYGVYQGFGAVSVLAATTGGLTYTGAQVIHQPPPAPSDTLAGQGFGSSLAVSTH